MDCFLVSHQGSFISACNYPFSVVCISEVMLVSHSGFFRKSKSTEVQTLTSSRKDTGHHDKIFWPFSDVWVYQNIIVLDASFANHKFNPSLFLLELMNFAFSQKFAVSATDYAQGLLIFGVKFSFIWWLQQRSTLFDPLLFL